MTLQSLGCATLLACLSVPCFAQEHITPTSSARTISTGPETLPSLQTNAQSMIVATLPLGAGQYQNRQYLKGGGFAAFQVGGILGSYYFYKKEKDFDADVSAAKATPTKYDDFEATAAKEFKQEQRQRLYICAGAALLSWGLGVYDAISNFETLPASNDRSEPKMQDRVVRDAAPATRYALSIIPVDLETIGANFSVRF